MIKTMKTINLSGLPDLVYGILLCAVIGVATIAVAGFIHIPVMLLAIIFGLILNRFYSFPMLTPGINWCAKGLLYIGVALMGLRIDFADINQAGFTAPALILCALVLTLLVGFYLGRALKQSKDFSILMSCAVGICGVSAAAAICAALDDYESRNKELAIAVAGITILSTIVMIAYPALAHILNLDNLGSAILMGGGIHNVSQAVGAGYAVSPETGDLSVLLKLMRVSMLLPIVILVSVMWGKNAATPYPSLSAKIRANSPPFLVIFFILAVLSCFHLIPSVITQVGNEAAHWALVISLVAIGIKTNMRDVFSVGVKPLVVMTMTTVTMALILLAGIFLLGAYN